jgi:hypothetical protein
MAETHAVMERAMSADEIPPTETLIGQLMSANFRDYSRTVQMHSELQEKRIADLEAELGAIRTRINELFAGPYMPTQNAVEMAVFYPDKDLIEQCRRPEDDR